MLTTESRFADRHPHLLLRAHRRGAEDEGRGSPAEGWPELTKRPSGTRKRTKLERRGVFLQ